MTSDRSKPIAWLTIAAIVALFFCAIAPTLSWLEFSGGSENLNIATALETRRTGHWLIPTLQDQLRIAKPPLTAWITAAFIAPKTVEDLSSPSPATWQHAIDQLAWQSRWPALLMGCLTLAAVFELGRTLATWRLGLFAALIAGGNYAFLRFCRNSTTDIPLALFVTIANVFIAKAIIRRQRYSGCIGAGLALGLALMSKGPVALLQTIVPAVIFLLLPKHTSPKGQCQTNCPSPLAQGSPANKGWLGPIAIGLAAMFAVAAPWFVLVVIRVIQPQHLWRFWYSETTGDGASDMRANHPLSHIGFLYLLLPWLIFFIGGLWVAAEDIGIIRRLARTWSRWRNIQFIPPVADAPINKDVPTRQGLAFLILLTIVPIILISFSRDRKERYLLPMVSPAAVLAAVALLKLPAPGTPAGRLRRQAEAAHWSIVAAAGLVFPIIGATRLLRFTTTADGQPWFSPAIAASAAIAGAILLITGLVYARRNSPSAILWTTTLTMLITQAIFAYGYSRSENGLCETIPIARMIHHHCPDATLYTHTVARRGPQDLSIYLNRPIHEIADPATIPTAAGSQALVILQRKGEPLPQVPPDWRCLGHTTAGKLTWWAYCRINTPYPPRPIATQAVSVLPPD